MKKKSIRLLRVKREFLSCTHFLKRNKFLPIICQIVINSLLLQMKTIRETYHSDEYEAYYDSLEDE